jgi:small subunit ribosomal protein S17
VVVAVDTTRQHPLYGKIMHTTKKFFAHDESNAIPVGSTVRIVESRPLSKRKRWMVEEVLVEVSEAAALAAQTPTPEVSEVVAQLLADADEAPAEGSEE